MIGNDRKYPDAVYSAVGKHELGDTLTRRQIEAVLDAAGPLILAAAYDRLADEIATERDSGRFGIGGTFGSGIQRAVLKIQRSASVLRGEGDRDG